MHQIANEGYPLCITETKELSIGQSHQSTLLKAADVIRTQVREGRGYVHGMKSRSIDGAIRWATRGGGKVYSVKRKGSKLKFTQPVLLQSFSDKFEMPSQKYNTPAIPGTVLIPGTEAERLSAKEATKYRSGVGKLMHMMQYSRPEIYNAVGDCSRHMKEPTQVIDN